MTPDGVVIAITMSIGIPLTGIVMDRITKTRRK